MKLVTYEAQGQTQLGGIQDEQIVDLQQAYQAAGGTESFPTEMIELLNEGSQGMEKAAKALAFVQENPADLCQPLAEATLLPPVTRPGKVIALGRNYAAHAAEGGAEPPKYPMLFHKTHTSLIGHGATIIIPPITRRADYEGELAVIMGRTCKQVSEDEALDYVAGYSIANDVSARDLQRRTTQFTAGKMLDTFGPLGPMLVTRDEIPDPGNLRLQTRLNGDTMQDGNTKMMIFSVPFTISYISQITTLEVGDVILTGTPEGVGYAHTPPIYLKAGDEVSIEIDGLGVLTNKVDASE